MSIPDRAFDLIDDSPAGGRSFDFYWHRVSLLFRVVGIIRVLRTDDAPVYRAGDAGFHERLFFQELFVDQVIFELFGNFPRDEGDDLAVDLQRALPLAVHLQQVFDPDIEEPLVLLQVGQDELPVLFRSAARSSRR